MENIYVPVLGESIDKALIVKWHKSEGDEVKESEVVVEIETDKITLEVPAPVSGFLKTINFYENEFVNVGDVLGTISKSEEKTINVEKASFETSEKFVVNKDETRKPMSLIRQTIANRLKQATAVTLTTFNEINMTCLLKRRDETQVDGKKISMLAFFIKSTVLALKQFEVFRSYIDGNDIVTRHYFDIGIAVASPSGLVVPIIKNADQKTIQEIDDQIKEFAKKAKDFKLTIEDIQGGSFTITNGGVFGSLMSTPLLNPPQAGILGLHAVQERPIALDGKVVIAKMMYVALSYDHRIVDGKEAVEFLKMIKDDIESQNIL